jgi:DNA ligase-1
MKDFQPLLAATCDDFSALRYPLLASPKLDGIRCVKLDGRALTRKLKPVPNTFVRAWVERFLPDGIDGELMLRDHRIPFNDVSSAIMSKEGEPNFVFMAFDLAQMSALGENDREPPFRVRLEILRNWAISEVGPLLKHFCMIGHERVETEDELRAVVARHLDAGYEGTMVRDPAGRYKFGRSTVKEGILLKIKPWHDEEATVIGVVEQMRNTNEAKIDNLGRTTRSSAKAGKVGKGVLGALECVTEDGAEFEIGTGFTNSQRETFWRGWLAGGLIGQQVKFRHLGRFPDTRVPRGPVFLGWRKD